jgi:hypothetical protein
MSFFWGRFDPIEGSVDEEVKHLYRRRELDPNYKNKEALITSMTTTPNDNPDNFQVAKGYLFKQAPNNAKYESMTEEERIENGILSKYALFNTSVYNLIGSCIWLGKSIVYYTLLNINFRRCSLVVFKNLLSRWNNLKKTKSGKAY